MSDPKKPKVLTRLRIDEVSMVDRGAGANCKVVISKRDDGPDYHDLLTGRTTCAELYGFDKRASADGDEHAPAEWLAIAKSNPPEDSTMPINLSDIVKSHGVVALAKYMVEQNSSFGATETELVQLATQDAERRYQATRQLARSRNCTKSPPSCAVPSRSPSRPHSRTPCRRRSRRTRTMRWRSLRESARLSGRA